MPTFTYSWSRSCILPSPLCFSSFIYPTHVLNCRLHAYETYLREREREREREMGSCRALLLALLAVGVACGAHGQLVPALIIFGDSVTDVGNNNNLLTLVRANFPPYGRDFVNHTPTGRFCNGKLATDITAEYLGFDSYPPPYLSKEASGKSLLTGVNFASGASGYHRTTPSLYGAISLNLQLEYYKEYQSRVAKIAGKSNASSIFSGAIHILSAGSSDFLQNYYINPLLFITYTADKFSDILIQSFSSFIQSLYGLGARRIGVTSLPPMGCLPASITLFGGGSNECVHRLNNDAVLFNTKMNMAARVLQKRFPDLKLVVFDIYNPLLDFINHPSDNGFTEVSRGCCGTGTIETSLLCNSRSIGTCSNASAYLFWDSFHPSEAANQLLADHLLEQGIPLIS